MNYPHLSLFVKRVTHSQSQEIVKCMYINKTDTPLAPFKSDCATRTALFFCTAGVLLFGVCSCVYDWLVSATTAM